LVEGVRGGEAQPGAYRTVQNYIADSRTREVVYTPPPPGDVPALMRMLVAWLGAETGIHLVLVAGIAQFQLVHVHPFVDGNGRTSRLLSTLCLYRAGYDFKRLFTLSDYYDRDRSRFYKEVKTRGERAIRRDILARKHRLNARQGRALEHLWEHGVLDIRTFESLYPKTSRRTLQRDLAGLETKGLIRQEGETNNLVYVALGSP
jgi:Fic family protein